MKMVHKIIICLCELLLVIYALLIIYPIIWMILSSFKDNVSFMLDPWSLPQTWQFENYSKAWGKGVQQFLLNSVFVSAVSAAVVLFISSMFSFCLARFPFQGSSKLVFLFFVGNMIPIHCVLIPLFSLINKMGMLDNLWTLVIIYVAFNLPMTVFLTYGNYQQLPDELQEASVIDGCNPYQMFYRVFLPLGKPALVTSLILTLVSTWNEFSFALVLINDSKKQTIPLGLMTLQGTYQTDYATLGAALTLSSLPIIVIYMFMSSKIQAGLTAGAVKG